MRFLFQNKSSWIVVLTVLLMGYLLFVRWTSSNQLHANHEAFLRTIEDGRWGKCEDFISEAYGDQWGWNREEVIKVMKDLRSQFLALSLKLENRRTDIAGERAPISGKLRVGGRGFGVGNSIMSELNRLSESMTFIWTKESFWPWGWKLTRIEHPELEIPGSYTPGDLLEMRDGQF